MQNMNQISLDMYQTLGMAVAVLFLGAFLKKRIKFLETFCIPSPVVGGLIFAIVSCIPVSYTHLDVYKRQMIRREMQKTDF